MPAERRQVETRTVKESSRQRGREDKAGSAGGGWVGTEAFYQAPLYPYVLAGCFRVVGDEVWKVRLVQAAWGAPGCGLVYLGTGRLFGRSAGVVAGMMLAVYGPAIFYDGVVQKASLTDLLVCGLFAVTTWAAVCAAWYAFV